MNRIALFFVTVIISSVAYGKTAKSTVILLSIDGFSYDYLSQYQPKNILDFATKGIKAKLIPVYPSKTFPNHLSIITGVYPAKHGIVHNKFYHPDLGQTYKLGAGKHNSSWLTAQPFWFYAQQQGVKSAIYFWPESEAKGQGSEPSYHIPYNNVDSIEMRFNQIITWLKKPTEQAPKLILSYFSSVDSAGHEYGLNSPELSAAITQIDHAFGRFINRLEKEVTQKVNVILLSDHGMVQLNQQRKINLNTVFNKKIQESIDNKRIVVAKSSTQLYLYFDHTKLTKQQQSNFTNELKITQKQNTKWYEVYRKGNYPKHWHLNKTNVLVIPDIIINAKPTASFTYGNYAHNGKATHGYDALQHSGLMSIFLAAGPDIVKGRAVIPFENIHIVPFMSQLLGITPPENIDGKVDVLNSVLRY
ncbi:MAG: alkaline phosphatase family protein [Litorilituus sp.]|jgi:predicted AlkP superfamily pyrophosphatase or phosphodiesterase|nr:alkaline phosphatase family protein [Litorilituus sp.]